MANKPMKLIGKMVWQSAAGVLLLGALAACGGGGGGGYSAPSGGTATGPSPSISAIGDPNAVALYVDGGSPAWNTRVPNAIYATVQICAPGASQTAANCATVDHVMVDTGSVGLRLFATAVQAANPSLLAALPQSSTLPTTVVGECLAFASGVTWGGVRQADLHWGGTNFNGSTAANIALQIIGDSDSRLSSVPADCSSQGSLYQQASALGANGVLGVGLFPHDCGAQCVNSAMPIYYRCSSAAGTSSCSDSTMPLAQQVPNPVAAMSSNNNGNIINLQGNAEMNSTTGVLLLGIGTQSNNQLVANSAQLALNAQGFFSARFNGNTLPNSFLDSGSTANFLPTTGTQALPACSNASASGYLCPPTSVMLSAQNTGLSGTSASASVLVVNAQNAFASNGSANVIPGLSADGGSSGVGSSSMDLGASFFLNRSVAILIQNQAANGFSVMGPAFGYTP